MKILFYFLLFCHVSSPVKRSLRIFFTASSGIPNFPEFVATLLVDDIQVCFCDSNKKMEVNQGPWKILFGDHPWLFEQHTGECLSLPIFFNDILYGVMQSFNQSEGVHILQVICGCEWDEKAGEIFVLEYGYNGEDIISFDLKNSTWIALKPQAVAIKQKWDTDKDRIKKNQNFLSHICPVRRKMYLNYGNNLLLRTDLPSVSLLQKTPSSPVSCHATGFYPDRAEMFWTKDGEEIHEDVDHGEILPNNDGTFQMRVDFNISSVKLEDRRRYDCVFQLLGVEKNIVTKLDTAMIRTNWATPSEFPVGSVIGVVIGLLLLAVCITGLFIWRKKKNGFRPANISDSSSSSDRNSAPE